MLRQTMTPVDDTKETPPGPWRVAFTSPALCRRIAVGCAALCLVKLILIVGLSKELFEIHWRVSDEEPTWFNVVAFHLFVVLAGLNLWKFSARCLPAGPRVVRAANIAVLCLGGLFILVTFHSGDRNYLNAVMTEMLRWKDLRWYLFSNSFFELPFLAVWVGVYAAIYYGLWRKGREHWVLRVTAVFAAIYIVVCLRDLQQYRNALAIVDCLGLACLVLDSRRLNPFWIALPLVGASALFILFRPYQPTVWLTRMNPEFTVLLAGFLLTLTGVTLIAARRGFIVGWWRLLPFVLPTFLLLDVNYPAAPNYENALAMGFLMPRYFLGEFGVIAALWLAGGLWRKIRPTGTLWWLDVANLLLVTLALVDLRLTQIMHVRLDANVLSLAVGETTKMMWRMSRPYLPSLIIGLVIVVAVYALALWIMRRRQNACGNASQQHSVGGQRSLAYAAIAFVLLGVVGWQFAPGDKAEGQTVISFAATSSFLKRAATPAMDRASFVQAVTDLGLADMVRPVPAAPAIRAPRDLNVIVIFQESTYNKHLSLFGSAEQTQPLLSQYRDRMELFPNFFSSFAGSINARFATFTGLYPVEDFHAFTAEHIPVRSIFEVLHDHGYVCSMFYSSYFDYTDFRGLLRNRGIDGLYDADTMPGAQTNQQVSWGLPEEATLAAMRDHIRKCAAQKEKFFMTYVPAAPHNPFDGTPRQFQKRKMEKIGDLTPFYLNELFYMDWTITSILDQLKESGLLDKTLVIITADHGEMLGEDGGPVGHGWAITPELANVPLIVLDPDHPGYHVNQTVGSQVDLLPTILDRLEIPLPQGELYQGASLYSANLNTNRIFYLNSFQQYGEVQGARFVRGARDAEKQGRATPREVFDIANEGARTAFTPEPSPDTNAPDIASFDKFQKNFLRNYSEYRKMFRAAP